MVMRVDQALRAARGVPAGLVHPARRGLLWLRRSESRPEDRFFRLPGRKEGMPVQAQSTTENDAKMFCAKCKTASLRRRTPGFFNQLTSFYPYTCGRCGNHQKKFRFTWLRFADSVSSCGPGGLVLALGNRPAFLTGLGAGTDTSAAHLHPRRIRWKLWRGRAPPRAGIFPRSSR